MRIISGNFKGKKISLPYDKSTRPLRDLVKESLFNIIQHNSNQKINLEGSNILDLFSGSGSFGLECFSRGAQKVIFIENYKKAIAILKKNIKSLNGEKNCKIIEENCFNYLRNNNKNEKFQIIFIDPPFKEKNINILIDLIKEQKFLGEHGIIVIHRHKNDNTEIPNNLKILENRSYGISKIIIAN